MPPAKIGTTHLVNLAFRDMQTFHSGQLDKSGVPYAYHPARVMLRLGDGATDFERIAALFHDVVEDTDVGLADLFGMGYPAKALDIVTLLTKRKSMTHRQYLDIILNSGNKNAMRVKLADIYDNSWEGRIAMASGEVRDNLKKMIEQRYKPAAMLLREALGVDAAGIIEGDIDEAIIEANLCVH